MNAAVRNLCLALAWSVVPCMLLWSVAATGAAEVSNLAGTWTWSWDDREGITHHHVLEVEGVGKKLAARERFDDQAPVPVSRLKVDGKQIRFTIVRGPKRADYSGVMADIDTINGTVLVTLNGHTNEYVWKATRQKPTPEVLQGTEP